MIIDNDKIYLIDHSCYDTYIFDNLSDLKNKILDMYHQDDICIGEFLSNFEVIGLNMDMLTSLYIEIRNKTGDTISLIDENGDFVL